MGRGKRGKQPSAQAKKVIFVVLYSAGGGYPKYRGGRSSLLDMFYEDVIITNVPALYEYT